jgi:hypothetical protein
MRDLVTEIRKIKKYIQVLEGFNSDENLIRFLTGKGIEYNNISYLGSGEYGTAYSLGNGRAFKITNSDNEFEIAGQLLNKKMPGIVQYYDRGWFSEKLTKYYIVMDELEIDSSIEDHFYRVELILTTQGLDLSEIGNFDEESYDGSEGELEPEIIKFMDEIDTIYRSCRNLGIRVPDINYGNLGYDIAGILTAFDLQDKAAMRNRMW